MIPSQLEASAKNFNTRCGRLFLECFEVSSDRKAITKFEIGLHASLECAVSLRGIEVRRKKAFSERDNNAIVFAGEVEIQHGTGRVVFEQRAVVGIDFTARGQTADSAVVQHEISN